MIPQSVVLLVMIVALLVLSLVMGFMFAAGVMTAALAMFLPTMWHDLKFDKSKNKENN